MTQHSSPLGGCRTRWPKARGFLSSNWRNRKGGRERGEETRAEIEVGEEVRELVILDWSTSGLRVYSLASITLPSERDMR